MVDTLEICIATSNEERCLANLRLMLSHCVTDPRVTLVGDELTFHDDWFKEFCTPGNMTFCSFGERAGPVASLQRGYKFSTAPIIAFIHDDVEVLETGWDASVLEEFNRPNVGVVGFGGALGLGTDDIYKTPYRLQQLARLNYGSNAPDWQTHGTRFTGSREVATLDGYALIVRRELLDKIGGWPIAKLLPCLRCEAGPTCEPCENCNGNGKTFQDGCLFHNYDNAICLYAKRHGYKVRQLGIHAKHCGGGTSVKDGRYSEWLQREFGKTDTDVHRESHDWLYTEFGDVLPVRV